MGHIEANALVAAARGLLSGPPDRLRVQFARYVVVGGIATVFDYGILAALFKGAGLDLLVATACGFTAGCLVNYVLSVRWAFRSRTVRSVAIEAVVFTLVGIAGLGITELCVHVSANILGLHWALAKAIAVVATLLWNFGARKLLLFRDRPAGPAAGPAEAGAPNVSEGAGKAAGP